MSRDDKSVRQSLLALEARVERIGVDEGAALIEGVDAAILRIAVAVGHAEIVCGPVAGDVETISLPGLKPSAF